MFANSDQSRKVRGAFPMHCPSTSHQRLHCTLELLDLASFITLLGGETAQFGQRDWMSPSSNTAEVQRQPSQCRFEAFHMRPAS